MSARRDRLDDAPEELRELVRGLMPGLADLQPEELHRLLPDLVAMLERQVAAEAALGELAAPAGWWGYALGAELKELKARLRWTEGAGSARFGAVQALAAITAAATAKDLDGARVGPGVRGALGTLAEAGDEHAAEALEEPGGAIRDRLARLVMARARELWKELDRRTGEALGESWGAVAKRFLRAEERPFGEEGQDRDEDRDVIGRLGALMVPTPWPAEVGEVLAWDAWLAEWLEAKGDPGQAKQVRSRAEKRAAAVSKDDLPLLALWREWSAEPGDRAWGPAPVLGRLAWLAWPKLRAELAKERQRAELAAAVALPAGQMMLNLRSHGGGMRVWSEDGRKLADLDTGSLDTGSSPYRLDPFAVAGMPLELATRLLAGDLRDLRGKAALGVLNVVLRKLSEARLQAEPGGGGVWLPKLEIPTGKALAGECGLVRDGPAAEAAERALFAWAAVALGDHRKELHRFISAPERRKHGGGRAAAFLVTPGELLMPTRLATAAKQDGKQGGKAPRPLPRWARPWRRIMPWPDELAPDDWASARDRGAVGFLALALVVEWTEAAGRRHGALWLDNPGVPLEDRGWGELVARADAGGLAGQRTKALDEWGAAGWIKMEGGLVAPGPKLPRLLDVLNGAAEGAKAAQGGERKRRR